MECTATREHVETYDRQDSGLKGGHHDRTRLM